jgi:DNA-directed RNA polymerase sigma subunit (sigma70/sigma32)
MVWYALGYFSGLAGKEKAGCTEETIAELERFFDNEKKTLKRRKTQIEKYDLHFISVDAPISGEDSEYYYEIPDPTINIEDSVIHKMEIEKLQEILEELPADDREFLYACYSAECYTIPELCKLFGLTRGAVQYRQNKLLKLVREKYLTAK